jgi:hypothetical protein
VSLAKTFRVSHLHEEQACRSLPRLYTSQQRLPPLYGYKNELHIPHLYTDQKGLDGVLQRHVDLAGRHLEVEEQRNGQALPPGHKDDRLDARKLPHGADVRQPLLALQVELEQAVERPHLAEVDDRGNVRIPGKDASWVLDGRGGENGQSLPRRWKGAGSKAPTLS